MKQERANKYINIFLISFSVISFTMLAISQLFWPYDLDHGIFATVADVILDGGVVYRDIWELKGPAVYYLLAFINWLCDREEYGIRIFDLIIVITGLYYFYRILTKYVDNLTSIIVSSVLGVAFFKNTWVAAEPDGWASILTIIIMWKILEDNYHYKLINASIIAILLGMVGLLKPPYLLYCILPLIYISTKDGDYRKKFNFILTIALGSFSIIYFISMYFWYNNALWDLIDNIFIYNWNFHKDLFRNENTLLDLKKNLVIFFVDKNIILPSLLFFTGLILAKKDGLPKSFLIFVWLLSSIFFVFLQGGSLPYQNLLVAPPMLIFSAIALYKIKEMLSYKEFILICTLSISLAHYDTYTKYLIPTLDVNTGKITKIEYYDKVALRNDRAQREVAKYIKDRNSNKDPVFILGFSSIINFLSDSPTATKYSYIMPFIESHGEYFNNISSELIYDLNKNKPKFIVTSYMIFLLSKGDIKSNNPLLRIKGIKDFLENNYILVEVKDKFLIYKRKI